MSKSFITIIQLFLSFSYKSSTNRNLDSQNKNIKDFFFSIHHCYCSYVALMAGLYSTVTVNWLPTGRIQPIKPSFPGSFNIAPPL